MVFSESSPPLTYSQTFAEHKNFFLLVLNTCLSMIFYKVFSFLELAILPLNAHSRQMF